ncbi:MAG: glycosyltransferase family 2 protein [Rhodothermales bacterium]|nr:glycosyltransferase family 2 protein [Rhodothermales bacterium]
MSVEQTRQPERQGERVSVDLSVVVPILDEADSLDELVKEIIGGAAAAGRSLEIVLVDDGSRDGSWAKIQELSQALPDTVYGIRFKRNYGKSAALAAGFRQAQGDYIITMDADLQDDPSEIKVLVEALDAGNDLVSGWKRDRKDPFTKTVPSRFFNFVTRKMSGIPLHDFNCGLKAYRSEVTTDLLLYGEMHRYIPLLAKWEGFDRITELQVNHRPRKYGQTKFGLERFVRGFLDLITVLFITRFAARPMHFFGTLGTISFLGGFALSLYLTIDKLVFDNPIGDRPLLLLGVILILLGSQLFMSGILGEMLIRQRVETHGSYHIVDRTR